MLKKINYFSHYGTIVLNFHSTKEIKRVHTKFIKQNVLMQIFLGQTS